MIPPTKTQILRLYKHLIRYGNQLTLTDKSYFLGRIRREFRINRQLTEPAEIEFNFKRGETLLRKGLLCRFKTTLDYSRYPKLNEAELEETFTRGSGPGGQAVNKTNNCVLLRHLPTNILVKCHTHRIASRNREEARRLLLEKLDAHYNGENSIAAQIKVIEGRKSAEKKRRQQKNLELKKSWKEREQNEKND